jgi:GT2 family glycosyltransferase
MTPGSSPHQEEDLPEVGIIILNWNNYEDTSNCLDSLQDINYPNYTIYVVDNGSSDGSGELLAEEYPHCEFVYNGKNVGFSSGINIGIEKALNDGVDNVLLLNNDTKPKKGFIKPLVNTAQEYDNAAIVSGIAYNEMGEVNFAGGTYSPIIYKLDTNKEVRSDEPYRTDFITGAFMLLTGKFLEEGYRFDEGYFFGREDINLCLTAKNDGWDLFINSESEIVHKRASSGGNMTQFRFYHRTRNYLYFASNSLPTSRQSAFYTGLSLVGPMLLVYLVICHRLELAKAIIIGVYDHINNKKFKRMEDFSTT